LLWPQHLTTAELFKALRPKKRPELHGSYAGFLGSRLTEQFQPADLEVALDWVSQREVGITLARKHVDKDYDLSRLSDEIVLAAFEGSRENSTIRTHLAKTLIRRLWAHYLCAYEPNRENFLETFRANTIERHLLIETLVQEMTEKRGEAFAISRIIPVEDF